MLAALFHGWRAAAIAYRVYEDPSASRLVTAGDLGDIGIWLKPEADAKAHAQCSPPPCPPLNGVDDDLDGLVDDLGYAARVFETFDGVGKYVAEPGLGFTLEAATNDASSASAHLREALRLVLMEGDTQADNATLIYGDGGSHPPLFTDVKSYNGLQLDGSPCPAPPASCRRRAPGPGVPLGRVSARALVPARTARGSRAAPLPDAGHPPRRPRGRHHLVGQGGGQAYNKATGTTYDPLCYPEGWVYTLFATEWGYTMERAVADTTPHYTLNLRDDVESALQKNGVDPADLGPDFQTFLVFLQDIDVRLFIESPENLRGVLPHFCPTHTEPPCVRSRKLQLQRLLGGLGRTHRSHRVREVLDHRALLHLQPGRERHPVDPSGLYSGDPAQPRRGLPLRSLPAQYRRGLHPGRLERPERQREVRPLRAGPHGGRLDAAVLHRPERRRPVERLDGSASTRRCSYAGEPAHPGSGLYNGLYVYFQDPTFGGRLPGVTNESLNNFIGTAAGWADGLLSFPSNNHAPANYHMVEDAPTTVPGANLRLVHHRHGSRRGHAALPHGPAGGGAALAGRTRYGRLRAGRPGRDMGPHRHRLRQCEQPQRPRRNVPGGHPRTGRRHHDGTSRCQKHVFHGSSAACAGDGVARRRPARSPGRGHRDEDPDADRGAGRAQGNRHSSASTASR